ncbi:ribosomal protein L22/L17 [Chytriomyces sp. MP71]|nr:ribosomal protein L22/L17 [Chytriomyces sp. MP71]
MLATLRTTFAARTGPLFTVAPASRMVAVMGVGRYSTDLFAAAMKEAQETHTLHANSSTPSTTTAASAKKSFIVQSRDFRISPKKMNLVAKVMRGLAISDALKQMQFSPKRAAAKLVPVVKEAMRRADGLSGSEQNQGWIVEQAFVGKGQFLKRIKMHARGRMGIMHHPSSHVKLVVARADPYSAAVAKSRRDPLVFDVSREQKEATEFAKLVHIFKRHKLYAPFIEPKTRFLHPVWSRKSWKYVTSKKWLAPR